MRDQDVLRRKEDGDKKCSDERLKRKLFVVGSGKALLLIYEKFVFVKRRPQICSPQNILAKLALT